MTLEHAAAVVRAKELRREEEAIAEIRQLVDRISSLIINTDFPAIDVALKKEQVKETIRHYFPDKEYLYDLLYEPRFTRLWQQFRRPLQ